MNLLEDRLNNAAEDARRHVARVGSRPATSIQSRQQHRRVLIGTVAVAAMFGIFGITALVMSASTGLDAASEPTVPPTTVAPIEATDTAPAIIAPVATDITHLVGSITASTELSAEFGATKLIDGDLDTAWNDASLGGSGAELVIEFVEPVSIEEIVIHPYRDEDRFLRNFWVQRFELRTSNHFETLGNHLNAPMTGTLTREMEPQTIGMYTEGSVSLSLKVVSSFPAQPFDDGLPFDELAVAEIQVFGTPTSNTTDSETPTTTTTIVGATGEELTRVIERQDDMVLFTRTAESLPEIFECAVDGTVVSESRHGSVTKPEVSATPEDALWSFLRQNAAEQALAIVGYVKLELVDESIVFGKPFEGLGGPMVTAITVTESEAGWSATEWSASGC